uniref:ER membrane protein complex subunit 1 n=2 Tax=Schistocephalus solidus TaxID=70667 RepID=A0A0X3Q530_SCHSO
MMRSGFYLIFTCFLSLILFHLRLYDYKIVLSVVYNSLSNVNALNISFSGSPVLRWKDVSFTHSGDTHTSCIFFPSVDISSKILTVQSLELPSYDSEHITLDKSVKKNLKLRHLTSDFQFILNHLTHPKVASAWLDGAQVVVVAATEHYNHSSEHTQFRLWLLSRNLSTLWSQSFSLPIATAFKPALSLQVVDCFHKPVVSCATVLFIVENEAPSHSEAADPFVLALDLKAGSLLWRHYPVSVAEKQKPPYNVSSPLGQHWKLQALASDVDRVSSKKWRNYRDLLLAALPIRWHGVSDTRALLVDGQPRILFILHSRGIGILNALSGEFIASLSPHLNPGHTIISRVDAAGQSPYLFRVSVSSQIIRAPYFPSLSHSYYPNMAPDGGADKTDFRQPSESAGGDLSHTIDCFAVFLPIEQSPSAITTWRVRDVRGLCRTHGILDYPRFGRSAWLEDEALSVPPLALPTVGTASSGQQSVYFLTSDGSLTSVDPTGKEEWRVNSRGSWLQLSRSFGLKRAADQSGLNDSTSELYFNLFRPSLNALNLLPLNADQFWRGYIQMQNLFSSNAIGSRLPSLLTLGWDSLSLIGRETGDLLATHDLPCPPVALPWAVYMPRSPPVQPPVVSARPVSFSAPLEGELFFVPCNELLLGFGVVCAMRWWLFLGFLLVAAITYAVFFFIYDSSF